jgi:purine nucleosidase
VTEQQFSKPAMPKSVIHNNDGHVDDLLSSILLWLSPEIDLQAVTITNGDCYADQSFEALLKMATYLDLEGAEVAYSEDPVPNPFPDNWRRESYIMNELPLFSENALKKLYQQGRSRKLEQVMFDCLTNSRAPVTIVTTGPLTNVAGIIDEHPDLKRKIEEFVIMGGAISAAGNVEQENSDGSAEWNMYADATAAKRVLDSGVPTKLIPLDVTNQLPVTKEFLEKLDAQSDSRRASMLAMKLWSLVKGFEYYFWDTVTAAAVIEPGLFTFKEMRVDITTQGRSQGRTSTVLFGGRKVKVATGVQKESFENLLLTILRTR